MLLWNGGLFRPGDFAARLTVNRETLTIDAFEAHSGRGKVNGRAQLKWREGLPFFLQLEWDDASFSDMLSRSSLTQSWVEFAATGQAKASGTLRPLRLNGNLDVKVSDFNLASSAAKESPDAGSRILNFDEGSLSTQFAIDENKSVLSGVHISTGRSSIRGDVVLNHFAKDGMQASLVADVIDFSDFKEIASFSWSGVGRMNAEIRGPYSDLEVEGQVNIRDFEFWDFSLGVLQSRLSYRKKVLSLPSVNGQKGRSPYWGHAAFSFGDEKELALQLDLPSCQTEDLVDLMVKQHSAIEVFQGHLFGKAAAQVRLEGVARQFRGHVNVDLRETQFRGRDLGDGKIRIRFVNGSSLVLDEARLEGAVGVTKAKGAWVFAGPMDFRFSLEKAKLDAIYGLAAAEQMGISGALHLSGQVQGDSAMPMVSAFATSPNVVFASRSLGPAHLEAQMVGRDLQLWGSPFEDAKTTLKLKLRAPFPFSANLRMSLPEIRPLLPSGAIRQGLSGELTGNVTLRGDLDDFSQVSLDATIDRLTLSRGAFSGRNEKSIRIHFLDGRLELEPFRFRGENTELFLGGTWGKSAVDMKASGAIDARLLESFVPSIDGTDGRVDLSVSMTGSSRDPSLVGSAELRDLQLSLKTYPISLKRMNGRIEFSDARALFQDIQATINEGPAIFNGDLRFSKLTMQSINLGVEFDQVRIRLSEAIPVTITGGLFLQGAWGALALGGAVEVEKLHYSKPVVLDSFLREVSKTNNWSGRSRRQEWLRFDVDLTVGDDVWIDNNLGQAKLGGKLKLTGNNVRPGVLGVLDAKENSRAYYRGNAFVVSKGEIQFKDARSIDVFVDLNAQTQVREFLVTLKTFGRASDPKVILTSAPSLPEADILTLLTLGVTSRDTALTERAVSGIGLAAEALLSASGLDRRVQSFLPKNAFLRDLQMYMATTYNSATRQVEPAWMMESKLIFEELKLSVVQPVSGFRGNRVQAEYRWSDQLSLRGQWDNENQGYSFGNPGVDLNMRFELE